MHRLPRRLLLALTVAASTAWACGNSTPTTPTPTPTVTPTTETFEGDLSRNGSNTHPFTVTAAGTLTATLTSMAPDNTVTVGVILGTWNGTSCAKVIENDRITVGITVTGQSTASGNLCLNVFDSTSQLAGTVHYLVTVVHP